MSRRRKIMIRIVAVFGVLVVLFATVFLVGPQLEIKSLEQLQDEDGATAQYLEYLPDTDTIFGWASDLVAMGARKPGTAAGLQAQTYVKEKLESFGLDVRVLETDTTLWECSDWSLNVGGKDVSSYFMSHTFNDGTFGSFNTGKNGISTDIVYVGDGTENDFKNVDVEGKIVMANVEFTDIPIVAARLITQLYYDPDHQISFDAAITNPYSANTFPYNYYRAMENGAVGFVGVLCDYFDSNEFNNEDYSYIDGDMKIPRLWVTNKDAKKIISLIESGSDDAVLEMSVDISKVTAGSVIATLPGNSEETIMIQSHYDSATPGGAEDASGTSTVLAMANLYSHIPEEERDRTLLFVLMDTHFSDYDSHDAFIEEYLGDGHQILADVYLIEGVPIISAITAPIYLYDNLDTADMIAKEELRPTAETFSDIVWRLMELPTVDFK